MNNEYTLKKVAFFILFLIALIAIPLTVYVAQRQQETRTRAAVVPEDAVVAVIDGQQITKAQVREVAEEQYAPSAVDTQALNDALDTILERIILDKEKTDKNINISDEEIQAKVENDGLSDKEAYYAVLRQKVTELNTKNWQVYTIGFWTPPASDLSQLTAEEKTQREQILSVGKTIISEAKTRLESGEAASDIAKSLLSKYPNFQGVLAVNGFQLAPDSEPTEEMRNPKIYTYETSAVGQPFYDTIYSMSNDGEIKLNLPADGSGGDVIQLVSSNKASFNTYEDWLADKKSSVIRKAL